MGHLDDGSLSSYTASNGGKQEAKRKPEFTNPYLRIGTERASYGHLPPPLTLGPTGWPNARPYHATIPAPNMKPSDCKRVLEV